MLRDFWNLIVGDRIGSGCYRDVYECLLDPSLVVKVEKDVSCFHNVREWANWQELCEAPAWRKWVAPCEAISPQGKYLLQSRTKPVTLSALPEKVPAFFTDKKVGNWGRLPDGRVVCHDYALLLPSFPLRMVKAKFWEN